MQAKTPFSYTCNYCKKSFTARDDLISHIITTHDDKSPYRCRNCYEVFANVSQFESHNRNNECLPGRTRPITQQPRSNLLDHPIQVPPTPTVNIPTSASMTAQIPSINTWVSPVPSMAVIKVQKSTNEPAQQPLTNTLYYPTPSTSTVRIQTTESKKGQPTLFHTSSHQIPSTSTSVRSEISTSGTAQQPLSNALYYHAPPTSTIRAQTNTRRKGQPLLFHPSSHPIPSTSSVVEIQTIKSQAAQQPLPNTSDNTVPSSNTVEIQTNITRENPSDNVLDD